MVHRHLAQKIAVLNNSREERHDGLIMRGIYHKEELCQITVSEVCKIFYWKLVQEWLGPTQDAQLDTSNTRNSIELSTSNKELKLSPIDRNLKCQSITKAMLKCPDAPSWVIWQCPNNYIAPHCPPYCCWPANPWGCCCCHCIGAPNELPPCITTCWG